MAGKKQSHHRITQDSARRADTIRAQTQDSFVNLSARVGLGAGSQADGGTYRDARVSSDRRTLEAAYKTSWICGAVVDYPAEDMTRAGIEFTAGDLSNDQTDAMLRTMTSLRIWDRIGSALKWSRLYGGAIAVMLVDGQDVSTPLRLETIARGQFKGLAVFDRWQIDPSLNDLVTEFGPDLGYPKTYAIMPGARALANQRVHYSRVIRIDGIELPFEQQLAENGWGQSVLERLWDRLVAFDSTTAGVAQLVYKAHIRTIQVEKLREIIAMGGKAFDGLTAQLNFIRQYQSLEGLTVLDASDKFEAHSYAFSGLDKVLLGMSEQLSGASQIPLVRLFGQSPGGLNTDGESALRTYYDGIKKQQETNLRSPFASLLAVLARSVLGVDLPEGFAFEFVSLWQMTPEQKATVAKAKGETVGAAFDSGIIDRATAMRELRHGASETGVFTHITDEDIDAADLEPPAGELGADLVPGDALNAAVPGAPGAPALAIAPGDSLNAAAA